MMERHIEGGQKTIAYKQLGLSMDVQNVSSPKELNLTTLHTYSIFENIVFLVIIITVFKDQCYLARRRRVTAENSHMAS